ncbi:MULTISPECIES: hypothetical protein [unclassified Paraflavitalea]|uniref:hypothetical protein n=1 Tax=unclassified Paraflavitalea TaxID=2798305 RepID=UPI003D3369AB
MQGILRFSFEDVALYSSSSSGSAKAFWLEFKIPNDSTMAQIKALSNKKVKIVGRVNLHDKGHLGAYCGTLDSVFCVK